MITKKILLFTLTVLFLSLVSCTGNGEGNSDKQAKIVPAFYSSVKTVKAAYETRIEMLTLTGQVEYDSDKVINYYPLTEGVAGRVYFSLGDKVEKGQVVAILEAMKMEIDIEAPAAGIVVALNVSPNDVVEEGQTLLTIN